MSKTAGNLVLDMNISKMRGDDLLGLARSEYDLLETECCVVLHVMPLVVL